MGHPRTTAEIREAFLRFFEERGHLRMPSDSLVPANDPTLLFTGAGMNQFKEEFLGRGRPLQRVTTVQKCLRVPDLENVGATPRHHTFFEMLGNFSFGDYFKAETIPWEWEFFTEVLGWDRDRFVATVYVDDEEAFGIWRDVVGLPEERIYRFGEAENFWPASAPSQGPNGPCGPCSELYWDQEPGASLPAHEGLEALPDRFLEVGNFVFTQFERRDGGELAPLPQRNIDVGLGLERIAAVAQGVPNNFETDVFAPLLAAIQEVAGRVYGDDARDDVRIRRIADHARAVFFCIADGAVPGREGRGYVVRKILRRAVRDGIELGIGEPFLAGLLPAVQETMAAAYPEIREHEATITALARGEEERFREVYERGIRRLEQEIDELKHVRGAGTFPGEVAFELHDTYGFPVDITEVVVREHGLAFDEDGFLAAMEAQKARARAGSELSGEVFAASVPARLRGAGVETTEFVGWERDDTEARVAALLVGDELREAVAVGEAVRVVLDRTPFYPEGGGQVGDRGVMEHDGEPAFRVDDTRREEDFVLHEGEALAPLRVGDRVHARLDVAARRATEAHHTATHLLHAALRSVLGEHVTQAGSKVEPERLRFDYTHPEAPSAEQLRTIEDLVLDQVLAAKPVEKRFTSLERARREGVMALFGEKYGDEVRVVAVPGFSQELCGGTHVANTGAIGPFRILSDRALAAGVRRLEAVAGRPAMAAFRAEHECLEAAAAELKVPPERLVERIARLREELKEAQRARAVAVPSAEELLAELGAAEGVAWKHLAGADARALQRLAARLEKAEERPEVVVLTGGDERAVPIVVLVREGSAAHAGELARELGGRLGGGGGGKPGYAQGRGCSPEGLEEAVRALGEAIQGV